MKVLKQNNVLDLVIRISQAMAIYNTINNIVSDIKHRINDKKNYVISIPTSDSLFRALGKYITNNTLTDSYRKNIYSVSDQFINFFKVDDSIKVNIKDHSIKVALVEERPSNEAGFETNNVVRNRYLQFFCKNKTEYNDVLEWLEELRVDYYTRTFQPMIYTASSFNEWCTSNPIPPRKIESIFLKENQLEDLIADLQLFYDSKDLYVNHGIPYHRGYMLFGPPGTGKSSVMTALANHFNKNVCILSTKALQSDTTTNDLFAEVPPNSFLIIEDIDTSHAVQSRDNEALSDKERTNVSTMLNALDGITTPEGLVLFMTTNKLELLDEGIIRPGRIDYTVELDYMDTYQLNNMMNSFAGNSKQEFYNEDVYQYKIKPTDITAIFKKNLMDFNAAVIEVEALVNSKKLQMNMVTA